MTLGHVTPPLAYACSWCEKDVSWDEVVTLRTFLGLTPFCASCATSVTPRS